MRKMIQQPLPFSSESRRILRIRCIAPPSLVSVVSTLRSRSSRSLVFKSVAVKANSTKPILIMLPNLLAHKTCLLSQGVQSTRYRGHRLILLTNHQLLLFSCPCRLIIVPRSTARRRWGLGGSGARRRLLSTLGRCYRNLPSHALHLQTSVSVREEKVGSYK